MKAEHYKKYKYEPIDVINDWGLNFSLGNVVKYVARCDHKGTPIRDLKKAADYLRIEIERREAETYEKIESNIHNLTH